MAAGAISFASGFFAFFAFARIAAACSPSAFIAAAAEARMAKDSLSKLSTASAAAICARSTPSNALLGAQIACAPTPSWPVLGRFSRFLLSCLRCLRPRSRLLPLRKSQVPISSALLFLLPHHRRFGRCRYHHRHIGLSIVYRDGRTQSSR